MRAGARSELGESIERGRVPWRCSPMTANVCPWRGRGHHRGPCSCERPELGAVGSLLGGVLGRPSRAAPSELGAVVEIEGFEPER
jgi:hypothetical protein